MTRYLTRAEEAWQRRMNRTGETFVGACIAGTVCCLLYLIAYGMEPSNTWFHLPWKYIGLGCSAVALLAGVAYVLCAIRKHQVTKPFDYFNKWEKLSEKAVRSKVFRIMTGVWMVLVVAFIVIAATIYNAPAAPWYQQLPAWSFIALGICLCVIILPACYNYICGYRNDLRVHQNGAA